MFVFDIFMLFSESFFEVKIEADNNDVIEHPHDDKRSIGMFGFSDAVFRALICLFQLFSCCWLCSVFISYIQHILVCTLLW